jgi:hypothetical protein
MATYRIENSVVDTDDATAKWEDGTFFDGHNRVSVATGSQWVNQTLYRSRKGRYYVETRSRIQGQRDSAEWVSPEEAARWLLVNRHQVPADLQAAAEEVSE